MDPSIQHPTFSAARDADDPLIGEVIDGRYRVERVLGTGGTGTVYQAEHVMMEKRVALKVLHETHAVISSAMERFQREAIALGRIEHPNVVTATDFGKLRNGAFYLALEYVDGVSLGEVLATEGRLDSSRALGIVYQIASALGAAHSQGIVHRDLKTHNVMLTRVGGAEVVKVLDFGLAKLRSKLTKGSISMSLGQVFGTPHYMAPEQISGEGVDHRVDIYALGVIAHEMLSGARPFDATEIRDVLSQQATQPPPPLPETVPAPVRALVGRMLSKQKEERPASAEEVMRELEPSLLPKSGPLGALLLRPLNLFGWVLPLWVAALPVVAFVFLFVVGSWQSEEDDEAPVRVGTVAKEPVRPGDQATDAPSKEPNGPGRSGSPELIAGAEFGEPSAMAELMKIPPEERSRELWLVLVKGSFAQKNSEQAVQLLRQAVEQRSELADDEEVSRLVRVAANDSAAAKAALAMAADLLGSRGSDLLFSVWADTKNRTPTTALAEQYLQQADVVERASPALRLALALRDEADCEKVRALLPEVERIGDSRALKPLTKLRSRRGCGPSKRSDCFACLRDGDVLEQAIKKAAARPGPRY